MVIEKKEMIRRIRKNIKMSFIACFLFFLFAVVLLRNPENFFSVAIHVFGYLAVFIGVLEIVFYFYLSDEQRLLSQTLLTGILFIVSGFASFFANDLLKNMVTFLLGGYFVYQNANRVQLVITLRKNLKTSIFYHLGISFLNILLAFFLMINLLTTWFPTNLSVASIIFLIEGLFAIQNIWLLFSLKEKKEDTLAVEKKK